MILLDLATAALLLASAVFFLGGTLGLVRFPDSFCRLHALTKADNLGLGLLIAGLSLQAESLAVVIKLVLVWLLVMVVGSCSAYLVARHALREAPER
jgi:multicomponent Na+:H+ antiporter subunit G